MAVNLVKHITQSQIDAYGTYPLSAGQKFYTDAGIYYEDIAAGTEIYRCAVVPSKLIATSSTPPESDENLRNNFAIVNSSGTYLIYYYDSGGVPNLISGSSVAISHNSLTGRDAEDAHPIDSITGLAAELDDKISKTDIDTQTIAGPLGLGTGATEWQILNEGTNFKIQEVDSGVPTDRIVIYETSSGGNPDAKVQIIGKLDAELDCGGW
jgi:hypothetical protein